MQFDPRPPLIALPGLADRPREVFRHLVEAFLASGEPVGSRTLSQRLPLALSPASIRNVMADLEAMGLLYAPHTSAGRAPTEKGLRLFVDGLLEIGELAPDERVAIEARMSGSGRGIEDVLTQATQSLSGLSRCAGLMVTTKADSALKHVEFVAAPYANAAGKIVGVIGVLGPTRLNYGRIIPMVDHTAKVIGRLLA